MHFFKIAFVLAPLIGLSAARPPHRPSPSGRITPLPSFSPFPSVSPPPIPSVTLPVPAESGFPGLIRPANPIPRDVLIPLDALNRAAQAFLGLQFHLDPILLVALNQAALVYLHHLSGPSFLVDLLRSVMRSFTITDLTHLADLGHLGCLFHR
ncbi:uncharacterized protein BHQ10_003644 [Talaromyces amestolkiae]|uniref:Uncharacterized protein n=1 Tax=Talaromyces amestolkiae TaxID=1196081 RepID=A0A364KVP9_TALAM|nr:uncharacterized protein BHQ10_003644 [Talaromyces amestolkiae]RAO67632.1 hypothetical protein BHQ10_003644 [Talaromyces amestolkiae]